MKKEWHIVAVERIKLRTSGMLKWPDLRELVAESHMSAIEELTEILEESRLEPEAAVEVKRELVDLLGTFPRKVTGDAKLVRKYLRQTIRKLT